eukprot:Hpha_TRINITY_DN16465_c1_g7::TRINITY_DN16465_c1_g7_i1::g.160755::m.160755/K01441/ACER1_2, ASAH3; alkaline ceramidase
MSTRQASLGRRGAPAKPEAKEKVKPEAAAEAELSPAMRWRLRAVCAGILAATVARCSSPEAQDVLIDSVRPHSSPIDWCEENYETHPGVAEFWNTFSNLATFPIVALAWWLHADFIERIDSRFSFTLLSLFTVGAGSMYFHSTLSILGQVLDEMCICWTNYYAILLVMPRKRLEALIGKAGRAAVFSTEGMLTVVLTTPIWAIFYPIFSHVTTVATIVLLPAAVLQQYRAGAAQVCPAGWRVLKQAMVAHCSAVSCWVLDKILCGHIPEYIGWNPQLHAWWHILVFLGAYLVIVGVCYIRSVGDGFSPEVKVAGCGIPYTAVKK